MSCVSNLTDHRIFQNVLEQLQIGRVAPVRITLQRQIFKVRRCKDIRSEPGVRGVTRPLVSVRMIDHAGSDGIQFNVSIAAEHIAGRFDDAGSVTTLPESPGPAVALVEIPHVALPEIPHEVCARARMLRREKQMDVVGHEAVRVHDTSMPGRQFPQMRQIAEIVAIYGKADAAVVAALDDMQSGAGQDKPGLARHIGQTPLRELRLTEIVL